MLTVPGLDLQLHLVAHGVEVVEAVRQKTEQSKHYLLYVSVAGATGAVAKVN